MKRNSALSFVLALLLSSPYSWAETKIQFSPKGGCEASIVNSIRSAKSHIYAAIYSLNNEEIVQALIDAADRGVKVRVLVDRTQASVNRASTMLLVNSKVDLRLHSVGRIMHNKFSVIDSKLAVTGSFNWTEPAENKNEENCVISDEPKFIQAFRNRFAEHLWEVNTREASLLRLEKMLSRAKSIN